MTQSDQGNITRQEAVSMIPPLFLDVQPHHTVLDICAAPGSKTTQIIEQLHKNGPTVVPTGLVIANDVDKSRCYMLVHHTKRLASPAIMVTNHPAQTYPRLPINLDRILADVPCSGDGTLRKNNDLWRRWSPQLGNGIHVLQLRIAIRAAQMLAVGGRMVYSTCSLNPIEDEAVIMELMRLTRGSLRLVDAANIVPGLKFARGVTSWRVMDRDGTWVNSFDDVADEARARIRPSMFPPTQEEAESVNLNRCMRLLPHLQNTGGFFVAVIEKVARLPDIVSSRNRPFVNTEKPKAKTEDTVGGASSSETKTDSAESKLQEGADVPEVEPEESIAGVDGDDLDTNSANKFKGKQKSRVWIEDPFLPIPQELTPVIESLKEYYGFSDFPVSQMFARSTKNHKLYFVSKSIENLIRSTEVSSLTVINTGVKIFNSHEKSKFGYRLCQDALQWFLPLIKKRRVPIKHVDVLRILQHPSTHPKDLTTAEHFASLDSGCVVLAVEDPNTPSDGMGFVAWYGKSTIQFLLKKKELNSLRTLLVPKDTAKDTSNTNDNNDMIDTIDTKRGAEGSPKQDGDGGNPSKKVKAE